MTSENLLFTSVFCSDGAAENVRERVYWEKSTGKTCEAGFYIKQKEEEEEKKSSKESENQKNKNTGHSTH